MSIDEHIETLLVSAADAALKSGEEIAPKTAPHRRQTKQKGDDDDDDGDEDEFNYWRFRDLKARNIVSDRADLHRKQLRGFPRAIKLSGGLNGVALFNKAEVKAWIRATRNVADPLEASL